jgi:hypothetical protein
LESEDLDESKRLGTAGSSAPAMTRGRILGAEILMNRRESTRNDADSMSGWQFRPKAQRRLHSRWQTSRSYGYVPLSAARVSLPPRRPRSPRNGSYRPHREAANATVQKNVQLHRLGRSPDRPTAAPDRRTLQSAGSSLAVEPTVPLPVCIRSLSGCTGGLPFRFSSARAHLSRSCFFESFCGRMTAAKPSISADVRCSMIVSRE